MHIVQIFLILSMRLLFGLAAVVLSACTPNESDAGGGNNGGATGSPTLQVVKVSDSNPLPFTTVALSTLGVDQSKPVSVNYMDPQGKTLSRPAIKVSADGTVVAAVPLSVDSVTRQTTSAAWSISLTQGAITSSSVPITIQDLPSVATYGTPPGRISHSFLVFRIGQLKQRLNQIESFQLSGVTSADVSALQHHITTRIQANTLALREIDRIVSDNSVIIPAGKLTDGTSVQFDRNALDMMDRVLAIFITQTFATMPLSTPQATSAHALSLNRPGKDILSALPTPSSIGSVLDAIETAKSWNDIVEAAQRSRSSCASGITTGCISDSAAALGTVATAAADALKDLDKAHTASLGTLGAVLSAVGTAADVAADEAALATGIVMQDQNLINAALDNLKSRDSIELLGTAAVLISAPAVLPGTASASAVVSLVQAGLSELENHVVDLDREASRSLAEAAARKAAQQPRLLSSLNGSIQPASGNQLPVTVDVSLSPFGSSGSVSLTVPTGSNGQFNTLVPANKQGVDYSRLLLTATDPVSQQQIVGAALDLRSLNSQPTETLPPITASQCTFTISGSIPLIPSSGGSGSLNVTPSSPNCSWTATGGGASLSLSPSGVQTGVGMVTYTVTANASDAAQFNQISIAGTQLTVTQSGSRNGPGTGAKTYVGTASWTTTTNTPNSGGCAPDPLIQTVVVSKATISLLSSGDLRIPGMYSVTEALSDAMGTYFRPAIRCPGNPPSVSEAVSKLIPVPAEVNTFEFGSNGPKVTYSQFIDGCLVSGSFDVSVSAVTGIVSLALDGKVRCNIAGVESLTTISATLEQQ